jgi:hypothetical protein
MKDGRWGEKSRVSNFEDISLGQVGGPETEQFFC